MESYFLDVDFTLSCTLVTHSRTESINRFNFGTALNQSHVIMRTPQPEFLTFVKIAEKINSSSQCLNYVN
ncbi:hypothetical protein Oscil6304_0906 [Oscillatoria acuminata PCC 6304]|uniref:Uncharacterized protein n=1 Tax=Oscillatoria acuminata PCC 6304 TaxID=56110 RepID=K9TDZ0_9CYAN|nr:hypothetical protein Oscil6304_0906 [Oscillatoria acuminata PCC 6304]